MGKNMLVSVLFILLTAVAGCEVRLSPVEAGLAMDVAVAVDASATDASPDGSGSSGDSATVPPTDSGTVANDGAPSTGLHTLVVRLGADRQSSCGPSGLQIVIFDNVGDPISSAPGQPLTVRFGNDWAGFVNVGATCNGRFIDWAPDMRTARQAGVESILLDGEELVDIALTCRSVGPGVKVQVPISANLRGRCR